MVDDIAARNYALWEEEEGSAGDLVVFAEEGQEKALVCEGQVAGEEAVFLRELCGENIGVTLSGLEGLVVADSSFSLFSFSSDWDNAFFACFLITIVEAHLIEVIWMERIQVHLLTFLIKINYQNPKYPNPSFIIYPSILPAQYF